MLRPAADVKRVTSVASPGGHGTKWTPSVSNPREEDGSMFTICNNPRFIEVPVHGSKEKHRGLNWDGSPDSHCFLLSITLRIAQQNTSFITGTRTNQKYNIVFMDFLYCYCNRYYIIYLLYHTHHFELSNSWWFLLRSQLLLTL